MCLSLKVPGRPHTLPPAAITPTWVPTAGVVVIVARAGRWTVGALVALLSVFGALLVATPRVAYAAPATGFDLSQYSLVGRYDLPEPSRTSAPSGSLLAQEASSVTYDWDTNTLFVVGDGGTSVVQVSKSGALINSMSLAPGSSPQGTTFYDTEAITYVGGGQFVLGEERYRQENLFTYVAGGTLTRADVQTVRLGTTIGNIGIEGITYDPQTSAAGSPGFVAVKEKEPEGIFQTNIDFAGGTATNGSETTDESANLFDPSLIGTTDLSDVYALSNLPSLVGTPEASHLLVISQESGKILNVDRLGNVESSLTISDPTSAISVPDETQEGVTMDRDGYLYTVSEAGGGDSAHPQLWVYAPPSVQPTVPRLKISEVAPWGSSTSYGTDWFEVTNDGPTAVDLTGWKMDDSSNAFGTAVPLSGVTSLPAGKSAVFFEDATVNDTVKIAAFEQAWFGSAGPPAGFLIGQYGGSGVGLSGSGDGVNLFDASGNRVTGVFFGASASVAPFVTFDNREGLSSSGILTPPTVVGLSAAGTNGAFTSPDATSVGSPGAVATTVTPPPPPTASVIVSEVAPWASGNAPYAADWFELTNKGTAAVDLTGWTMDDNSDAFGTSVALAGVTSLPAGKSAVFFEDTGLTDATVTAAFAQAWFGSATLPAGYLIGHYGGSGVGLSSSGDHVNIFNAAGARVTGVSFGASPTAAPYATFDNTAGLTSTTLPLPSITTLSAVGTNAAILAADGNEVGSPETPIAAPIPPMAVTEVAPWGSGSSTYAVDWFELTNTGPAAVNLTGWTMDDNSNAVGNSVPLAGLTSLPAGKSAVFFEDTGGLNDATVTAAFAQAWFGSSTLPAGFLIGHYGGSGVGLSTSGDAVNVFDSAGNRVTGIAVSASPTTTPFATFDNTGGAGSTSLPLPTVTTLSAVGTNGAFLAADGKGIGSPDGFAPADTTAPTIVATANPVANASGWNNSSVTVSYTCTDAGSGVDAVASSLADDVLTDSGTATGTCVDKAGNSADASYTAQIDTVLPTVTYSGNTGTYGILATVNITCAAADALSGLESSTCPNASGPAWSFGAGVHALSAQATDVAGNIGQGSATFTVTVKPADLSKLTRQFVEGSTKYKSSGLLTRLAVSARVGVSSNLILGFTPSAKPAFKAQLLASYAKNLQSFEASGWLTDSQVSTLTGLAAAL
jgi:uncharacterized protein YjiK